MNQNHVFVFEIKSKDMEDDSFELFHSRDKALSVAAAFLQERLASVVKRGDDALYTIGMIETTLEVRRARRDTFVRDVRDLLAQENITEAITLFNDGEWNGVDTYYSVDVYRMEVK